MNFSVITGVKFFIIEVQKWAVTISNPSLMYKTEQCALAL